MKIIKTFMCLAFVVLTPLIYATPSFDCGKAQTDIEKTICKNKWLGDFDRALDIIYKQALLHSNNPKKIKIEQIQWQRTRPNFEKRIEERLRNLMDLDSETIKSQRAIWESRSPNKDNADYEENLISSLWRDYLTRIYELLEEEDGKLRSFFLEEFLKSPEKSDKTVTCFAILKLLRETTGKSDNYNLLEDVIKNFHSIKLRPNKILVLLNTSRGAYVETYDFYIVNKEAGKINLLPYLLSDHMGPNCNKGSNSFTGDFSIDFNNKMIEYNTRPSSYEAGDGMVWKLNENCGELIEKDRKPRK